MRPIDYAALYAENEDFKRYVDKYCAKTHISVERALQHNLVQMAGMYYKKQSNNVARKE